MKSKKIIALLMVSVMAMASLAACGGSGGDEKPETKTESGNEAEPAGEEGGEAEEAGDGSVHKTGYPVVDEMVYLDCVGTGEPGNGEWKDFPIFQEIADQTNVQVNWTTLSGDGAEEKLNLLLSSKDLPDAIFSGLSTSKIIDYAQKGILRPIEDLIEDYAPNLKEILDNNPDIRKAITMPDGHIYAVPAVNENSEPVQSTTLNLNQQWLDALGLDVPTTTEEFEAVLEAFKTGDPNGNGEADEIPFSFEPVPPYHVWNGDAGFSGCFGITGGWEGLMYKDGELLFTAAQPGYKEYILWLNKLYTGGLIDVEIFTQDHDQYMAKISSDRLGGYLTNGPVDVDGRDYVAIAPLKGPNGDQVWGSLDFSIDKNRGVITTTNEHPEATMRYIDSFYEEEFSLKLRHGIWLTESEDEPGKYEIKDGEPGVSSEAPGPYVGTCIDAERQDKYIVLTKNQIEAKEREEMYRPYLADPIPLMNFTAEESKNISALQTDINKVVDESKAKWVTGQADIEAEWDSYLESLDKMGLGQFMEIYGAALDRFEGK